MHHLQYDLWLLLLVLVAKVSPTLRQLPQTRDSPVFATPFTTALAYEPLLSALFPNL